MTAQTRSALTAEDWIARALHIAVAEGVEHIKINRLCRELGVTKGSFYWHFTDLEALLVATADTWCRQTREALASLKEIEHLPPKDRLEAMSMRLIDEEAGRVERALRQWARQDANVAAVIDQTDCFIFDVVQAALLDLGCTPTQARIRAGLLVFAGMGFAQGQTALPKPTADEIHAMIEFVSDRP